MTKIISAAVAVAAFLLVFQGLSFAEEAGLGGDILYTKPVKSVMFKHKPHVEDFGLSCNLCHDKIFQMDALNAEKSPDFNHKGFKAGKYCGACHDGKSGFGMEAQCTRCHGGVKAAVKNQKKAPAQK